MLIGTLQIELHLPAAGSLKEKRFILKSLKTRIRNKFNISIAEVDYLDKWQRTVLGFACVANERRFLDETLAKVFNAVEKEDRVIIVGQSSEIF
jgi:uncharacterized protein YlxP (DUF503 family)